MYSHSPVTERRVKKFRQQSFVRLRAGSPALPGGSHAAEHGWVSCRRRQGAVRVVDCQCCPIDIVQFLLTWPVNPFLN